MDLEPVYTANESSRVTKPQSWASFFFNILPSRRYLTATTDDDELDDDDNHQTQHFQDEYEYIQKKWQLLVWDPPKWSLNVLR